MQQTKIDTSIWEDAYFRLLLPTERLVFINMAFWPGKPEAVVARDCGLSEGRVANMLTPKFKQEVARWQKTVT